MISGDTSLGLRDKGYGPDVAIFRSLFSAKNVFRKEDKRINSSLLLPKTI
ncbi:MAG: hypothetical protein IPG24_26345 [Leptospiraceae bacterium]|nr:hypothetical protein [Leptospiraceae bacterium]